VMGIDVQIACRPHRQVEDGVLCQERQSSVTGPKLPKAPSS
jgi:hypothetical protein